MKEWKDPTTGCRVRRLTDFDGGATRIRFRVPCNLPDGRIVVTGTSEGKRHLWLVDIETAEAEPRPTITGYNTLYSDTGRCWFVRDRDLWAADLMQGTEEAACRMPDGFAGKVVVSSDGRIAWGSYSHPPKEAPSPRQDGKEERSAEAYHRNQIQAHERATGGGLKVLDLRTEEVRKVHEFHTSSPGYLAPSPTDPDLLAFAHMSPPHICQRIWLARADGEVHPIRPQECGEAIIHEYWWPGGKAIGYKYLDVRKDPNFDKLQLLEYSSAPLHVGFASLDGKEQWLSDPLEHYQSHIIVSPDERWFCGEGTHDWFFVTVARFDPESTHLDFKPVATTHAPYLPASGAGIETSFSADSRWVIYNDQLDGVRQVYAVEVPRDWE